MTISETMSIRDTVNILSTMTNRDEAGRHFTERYADRILDDLESRGLIEIDRPVHEPTGIPYSEDHWHLTVTQGGIELVEAYPEYWEA